VPWVFVKRHYHLRLRFRIIAPAMQRKRWISSVFLLLAAAVLPFGCFYPPLVQSNAQNRDQVGLPIPYDLAWDAVLTVIKKNELVIHAQDPTHGIVEAETHHFTLTDADCGVVGTAAGKTIAEPNTDASAVFNFYLAANGNEATNVSIQAVFSTPVRVPFHPMRNVECVSKGVQESRLLKEVQDQAAAARRPTFKKPKG
jgi:hypothetical protein